jgi:LacI family transcriptional regulator
LPTLLINTRSTNSAWPSLRVDNRAGAVAVARHLAELGRKRVIHIAGPSENIDAQERRDAFAEAAASHGLGLQVVEGDFYEESGEAAVAELLRAGVRFDSVFAANDNMAIGAITALRAAGLRVPEDVAVAGFDDIPLARHLGLTTVRVRIAELGERAIVRLLGIIAGEDPAGDELHAPELVVRATTDREARPQ